MFGGPLREISGGVDATSWFHNVINCNVSLDKNGFNPWALAIEHGNKSFFEPLAGGKPFARAQVGCVQS